MPGELDRSALREFAPRGPMDLCGRCGHACDHRERQCQHDVPVKTDAGNDTVEQCKCPGSVRADVFLCGQVGTLIRMHKQLIDQNNDLFTLLCFVHGVEIGENGEMKKKVQLTL